MYISSVVSKRTANALLKKTYIQPMILFGFSEKIL